MEQLTELLKQLQAGDAGARNTLFAAAYSELHLLAHARLRNRGGGSVLDTTSLVHESYLRFVHAGELRAGGPSGILRLRFPSHALRDRG